ncbi:diguanylate cyclase domain-containing protein [Vibrio ouci]|uniref:diguanylate cyclase domain-containing protein n=1 Tax=Vibrio ouci TaxID=2499078 RepID=UPI001FC95F5C|nr:diguanylate cyclase [Vibrio ouci]
MVADALQQAIREYDIAARWADDEFLLLIRSGQCETLQQVANRIQEYVDEHPMIPGTDTRYVGDLAIGGTLINPDMSLQQALALTDSSLYIAKSQQEGIIYIHTHALEKKSA